MANVAVQVTPDYPGNFTVFLLQAAMYTLETWDRYEPIKMAEKAKSTEQWLKDDGLVNNDGTVGLKWDTIPDPFCHYFPFEVRHPGKAPYLDPKFRFRVRNLSPKTNKPKASRKAPLRRSARLQALSSPGTSRTRTKSAARSKKGKK